MNADVCQLAVGTTGQPGSRPGGHCRVL